MEKNTLNQAIPPQVSYNAITPELSAYIENYQNTKEDLKPITNSFWMDIDKMLRFLNRAKKQNATILRGYFVRFPINNPPVGKPERLSGLPFEEAGQGLTQVSIAFVPALGNKYAPGQDILLSQEPDTGFIEDTYEVLYPGGETTGLCPANCGGSVGGNS